MNNLRWTYYRLSKLAEVKEVATEAESVGKIIFGVDHPKYKNVVNLLWDINEALLAVKQESVDTLLEHKDSPSYRASQHARNR